MPGGARFGDGAKCACAQRNKCPVPSSLQRGTFALSPALTLVVQDEEVTMRTHFRQAIATVALIVVSGALSAATAQTIIATEPTGTRTIVREPLNLTPAQRTTVYRTIVPQGRGKQP